MKKIIKIAALLTFAILAPGANAQVPFLSANICPGNSVGITAVNSMSLSNPSYSLEPGGSMSSNPVFTVSPAAPTVYTLYVTGTNTNSVLVTTNNTVSIGFLSVPEFSLPSYVTLGCGSQSAAVVSVINPNTVPPGGAMTFSFFAPGSSTVLPNGSLSSSPVDTLSVPGTWSVVVRDENSTCTSWSPLTIYQNTNAPVAQINGANTNGPCSPIPMETLANGSYNATTTIPAPLGTQAILWEGPFPQTAATFTSLYMALISGVYTLTVMDGNNGCTSTATVSVIIRPTAAFAHTITGGQAIFNDVSVNTNSTTAYYWDFGDGNTSLLQNPTHNYLNGGAHLVTLAISNPGSFCSDTVTQYVNISGVPCLANSGFSMVPTATAQVWDVIPDYPWNISAASWDWGDGSFSNTLYTSHQYAAAGLYNICLTVTVSCAASSSSCLTYNVYKGSQQAMIIQVNVVAPALISGVNRIDADGELSWNIIPNPNAGEFKVSLDASDTSPVQITISDLTGRMLHNESIESHSGSLSVSADNLPPGMYLVTIQSDDQKITKRMLVHQN